MFYTWCQAITLISADLFLTGLVYVKQIQAILKKMHLKISFAKYRSFCLSFNILDNEKYLLMYEIYRW